MAQVVNLGEVADTRAHDYRLFYYNLVLNAAFGAVIWYLWEEGTIAFWFATFKIHYSIALAILYVVGALWSVWITWKISSAHNALKRQTLNSAEMVRLFGLEFVEAKSVDSLKEIARNELAHLLDKLQYIAYLAVIVGIIGTIDGLMQAFVILSHARPETLLAQIVDMAKSLALYGTSMPGILIFVMVGQMYRLARRGAYDLYHRIVRALETRRE